MKKVKKFMEKVYQYAEKTVVIYAFAELVAKVLGYIMDTLALPQPTIVVYNGRV